MSLMLDALKRIEAKHASAAVRKAAGSASRTDLEAVAAGLEPIASPADATPDEPIELPPKPLVDAGPADALPGMPWEEPAPPEQVSLEAAMDQLQAFVSEAGQLYDAQWEFDAAEFQTAEQPAAAPLLIASALEEAPPETVDEVPAPAAPPPPAQAVESSGRDAVSAEKIVLPEAAAPVVAPVASPVALDPYAATAQQILRQLPRGRTQVLLFTGLADGQGKTMTLARLAPLLARGVEGDVLVVDANFRNADMARWLAVAPAWRLPDVLAGATDWATAVQATAHAGVSLLPGGSDAGGRSSGRNVQDFGHLLRDLAGHYDLVVVDASSLAHRGTAQLAAACDATYLVVRLGEASPRMLREAVQVIQHNGGRLRGCVAIDAGAQAS